MENSFGNKRTGKAKSNIYMKLIELSTNIKQLNIR